MSPIRIAILSLILALPSFSNVYSAEADLSALDIIQKSDALLRRDASFVRMTMVITRPDWTRALTMEAWSRGTSHALIRILSPKKDRGVGFLKQGREAWQFIPAIDRTIKIPPSMMLQSWLGSDFTNDDVVRADSIVVDYHHSVTGTAERDGDRMWIIESIPKPDAAVVWGKIVTTVRMSNFVPDRSEYFDEDGALIKYYQTSEIKTVDGLDVATRMTMHDHTRPGYHTELTYSELTFNPQLRTDTFSLRNLKR